MKKFLVFTLCFAIALLPTFTLANGRRYYPQRQVYHAKNNVIVKDIIIKQKKVLFDADYFLGSNGYYDVVNELKADDYIKDRDIILKQSEQMDRLLKLMEEIVKLQQNYPLPSNPPYEEEPSDPSDPVDPQPEQPQPDPEEEPVPEEDPKPESPTSDLDKQVFEAFKTNCGTCHGPTKQEGGLQLIGKTGNQLWLKNLTLKQRVEVFERTQGIQLRERGKKLMPLGGPQLEQDVLELFELWMYKKAEDTLAAIISKRQKS